MCQLFYPSFLFCCCRSFVCIVQGHKCSPPLSAELCGATGEPAGSGAAEKTRGSWTGATRTTGAAHIPFNTQQPMEGTIPYFLHRYTYFKSEVWRSKKALPIIQSAQMFLSLSLSRPLNLHKFAHQSKPEAAVVSYLVFIKLHSTSSQEYSDIAVPVLTSRGLLCPGNERVHFSVEYGNINLPERLPGKEKPTFLERNPASWAHIHFLEASSNLTQQPYLPNPDPSVEVLIHLIAIFWCLYLDKYTQMFFFLLFPLNLNSFSLYPWKKNLTFSPLRASSLLSSSFSDSVGS